MASLGASVSQSEISAAGSSTHFVYESYIAPAPITDIMNIYSFRDNPVRS